jgi:hypothetical protein
LCKSPAGWWDSDVSRKFLPPIPQSAQSADYIRILPEIVLSIFGMIVMLLEPLLDKETGQPSSPGWIAFFGSLRGSGRHLAHGTIARPRLLEHGASGWLSASSSTF